MSQGWSWPRPPMSPWWPATVSLLVRLKSAGTSGILNLQTKEDLDYHGNLNAGSVCTRLLRHAQFWRHGIPRIVTTRIVAKIIVDVYLRKRDLDDVAGQDNS